MNNYKELKELLIKYSDSYYKDGISLVSDDEFDKLLIKLKVMEETQGFSDPDSPTINVGIDLTSDNVIEHKRPMLSLDGMRTHEELKKWIDSVKEFDPNPEFICEYKYDGNSAALRYENGKLVSALTRGDGKVGEVITPNVSVMETLPKDINFTGEIRGEIIMLKEEFERVNSLNNNEYANPRNLVAGTLKLLDIEKVKERKLSFFGYWLEESKNDLYSEDMDEIIKLGFNINEYHVFKTYEEIVEFLTKVNKIKKDLPFEIDGVVIKVNNKKLWEKMGETSKFPRWAKAYKFEPDSLTTVLTEIKWQFGRTGKLTPVAIFNPIELSGSVVSRASLSNIDFIKDMDLKIGDVISVRKAMEIIPEIFKVHKSQRDGTETDIEMPDTCPYCNGNIEKISEEHLDYYCVNKECPQRIIQGIVYYTKVLGIDGFAENTVTKLYEAGYLKSITDLYELKNLIPEISKLDRMGIRTANKLANNVTKSISEPFVKYLTAFGIRNVGSGVATKVVDKYYNLKLLMEASVNDISKIEGVGNVAANNIVEFLKDNEELLNKLNNDYNVKFQTKLHDYTPIYMQKLYGKNFVITGTLSKPRNEFEKYITTNGGNLLKSVSNKVDYLVVGMNGKGSSKYKDADELGIKMVTESEFYNLNFKDYESKYDKYLNVEYIEIIVKELLKTKPNLTYTIYTMTLSNSVYIEFRYENIIRKVRISDHKSKQDIKTLDISIGKISKSRDKIIAFLNNIIKGIERTSYNQKMKALNKS